MKGAAAKVPQSPIEPLGALRELARSAAEDTPSEVLELVADVILRMGGYRTLAMNVYRPQFDDFQVVLVRGSEAARAMLEGESMPREDVMLVTEHGEEREPGIYFVAPDSGFWDVVSQSFVPDLPRTDDPDAWTPEDALLAVLRDVGGEPLGFVSMDEPRSGMRPGPGDLRLLSLICSFAEQALRNASRAARLERERRMLARITEVSAGVSACASRHELHGLVASTIATELGFERVAVYTDIGDGTLTRIADRGWGDRPTPGLPDELSGPALIAVLDRHRPRSGCWVVPAADLLGTPPPGETRSRRNGRGALAWRDHCALVPWRTSLGAPAGVVVAEDPSDRLLPDESLCRAIRLLVDLAASVEETIDQRARLDRLAGHDTLTGLRNRRGLDELLADSSGSAVVSCDLDRFKEVNDGSGHPAGDRVLQRFGALLLEVARPEDVAVRLGGDEFCLVLPRTSLEPALQVAERIRAGVETWSMEQHLAPLSVSIGVAAGVERDAESAGDARALLTTADRALYRAKRDGGNRVVGVRRD